MANEQNSPIKTIIKIGCAAAVIAVASLSISSIMANKKTVLTKEGHIAKSEIVIENGVMTPEALLAFGRMSDPQVSPDGKHILYGVSYTSIEQNKGNRELYLMNLDGSNNIKLTSTPKSESNARWISDSQIVYMRGGKLYTATLEGGKLAAETDFGIIDRHSLIYQGVCKGCLNCAMCLHGCCMRLQLPLWQVWCRKS